MRDMLRDDDGRELPPPPRPALPGESFVHALLLPDDEGDDATCYRVAVHHVDRTVSAEVTVLRSGAWAVLCSASAELAAAPERIPTTTLLAGGKVYILAASGYIICVDLVAASLSAVELPEGVTYDGGNLVLSRGDDSVLYILHLSTDQKLNLWLRTMDDEWVLRETIPIKEICDRVITEGYLVASVASVGENGEFVFLKLLVADGTVIVYLHLGSRRAEKLYQIPRDPDDYDNIRVHPFVMVWRPVFPPVDSDVGEHSRHG